jgi:hypothetical protein
MGSRVFAMSFPLRSDIDSAIVTEIMHIEHWELPMGGSVQLSSVQREREREREREIEVAILIGMASLCEVSISNVRTSGGVNTMQAGSTARNKERRKKIKVHEKKMNETIKGKMIEENKIKKHTYVYNRYGGSGSQPFP